MAVRLVQLTVGFANSHRGDKTSYAKGLAQPPKNDPADMMVRLAQLALRSRCDISIILSLEIWTFRTLASGFQTSDAGLAIS